MQIRLNGDIHSCEAGTTLAQLLAATGYAGQRVAVEVNRDIVPRSAHEARVLSEGDAVEIVHAIGGG